MERRMLRTTIALLAAAVLLTVPKSANAIRETASGSERAYWKRRDLIELDAPGNEKKSGEVNPEVCPALSLTKSSSLSPCA